MEAPEYFHNTLCRQQLVDKSNNNAAAGDSFMVEDLLDFSNDDAAIVDVAAAAAVFDNGNGNSTESSTLTVVHSSSNSSSLSGDPANFSGELGGPFSSDLCVPYDDLAVLEWQLSSFSEDSFSSEDLQKLQLISGIKAPHPDVVDGDASETRPRHHSLDPNNTNNPIFNSDVSIPAKARSKRSRAASANWTSRLLLHSPSESSPESSDIVVSAPPPLPSVVKKTIKKKERESPEGPGDGRKCLHCATDKTPQWRTGPMGPKTLCNACGVRYKSGRLVPEYRPAASPTFVLTKHSNSHRKVLELRRQKEMVRAQQYVVHHHHQAPPPHHHQAPPPHHHHHHYFQHGYHNSNVIFDMNGGDYLIHQHVGPDFRQLI